MTQSIRFAWIGSALVLTAAMSCGGSTEEPLFENNAGAAGSDASTGQGGASGNGGLAGQAGDASVGSGGVAGEGGSSQGGSSQAGAGNGGSAGQGGSSGAPTIGTEFWAVDLPNERGGLSGNTSDWPAQKSWGVLVANHASSPAHVVIERNTAPLGSTPALEAVATLDIEAGAIKQVALPTREVNGWTPSSTEPPGPPGTTVSSNAFRISSDAAVSVVQLNNLDNSYSSDASALLSGAALGTSYRAVGWPAANPVAIGGMNIAGIPDHSAITIVGTTAGTTVTVTLGGAIMGDGAGIKQTAAGGVVQVTLGAFDVLNLSSYGGTQSAPLDGDLTGTLIEASHPVAVFTSAERAMVDSKHAPGAPVPPGYEPSSACCTEHLEEQLRPASVAGSSFVLAHSPWRSTGAYKEPDLLRFMALSAPADVVTSLPAPFDHFNLNPGEFLDAWATSDAVITSTAPLAVAQLLASKMMTTSQVGDPSLLVLPPVAEYSTKYVFAVPVGWSQGGVSIATPQGNTLSLDGTPLGATCDIAPAGTIEGTSFEALRCPVAQGNHVLAGAKPFGLSVFAYGDASAWSYAASGD